MWNHSGGKGGGAAKQRVILGSFCWVPVSLRDGGHPVDKKGIWTTLYLEVESVVPQASEAIQEMGRRNAPGCDRRPTQLRLYQEELQGGAQGPQEAGTLPKEAPEEEEEGGLAWEDFVARKPAVAWLPHVQHNAQAPQVGWWISSFTVAAAQNTIGTSIFTMLPDYPAEAIRQGRRSTIARRLRRKCLQAPQNRRKTLHRTRPNDHSGARLAAEKCPNRGRIHHPKG